MVPKSTKIKNLSRKTLFFRPPFFHWFWIDFQEFQRFFDYLKRWISSFLKYFLEPRPPNQQKKMPHVAIEGVLTRQKCAETPYATFWHPSLKDLVPQKVISSLFKLSGFSLSRNTSNIRLRSFYFVPGTPSSYFQIFPQRCAPENDRNPSFQKLIWCHMVPVGEKSDVICWS